MAKCKNQSRAAKRGSGCFLCSMRKKKCSGGDPMTGHCDHCSLNVPRSDGDSAIPAVRFYDEDIRSHLIGRLGWEEPLPIQILASMDEIDCILKCSDDNACHKIYINGGIYDTNERLLAQLDTVVIQTWAPKVEAEVGSLTYFALLGIGYFNLLTQGKIMTQPESLHGQQHLSTLLSQLFLSRIDILIHMAMTSERETETGSKIDARNRPAFMLWYIYIWMVGPKLNSITDNKILDNEVLFNMVSRRVDSFEAELKVFLNLDCNKNRDWSRVFNLARKSLKQRLAVQDGSVIALDCILNTDTNYENDNSASPNPQAQPSGINNILGYLDENTELELEDDMSTQLDPGSILGTILSHDNYQGWASPIISSVYASKALSDYTLSTGLQSLPADPAPQQQQSVPNSDVIDPICYLWISK